MRVHRWFLIAALIVGAAPLDAMAQPVVRLHRRGGGAVGVVVVRPNAAPPAIRAERRRERRGFVWTPGQWDWRGGRWVWAGGHLQKRHPGRRWRELRWEQQGSEWVKVGGDWDDAPAFPTAAPPELRAERVAARRGFVWVRGRWNWQDGDWDWVPGHYERLRARQRWNDGRWNQNGDRYEWVEGGWVDASVSP